MKRLPHISQKHQLRSIGDAAHGFSLVEVLVAVTLMSVIVLGLMAMFGETQRAFRTGITQVNVMESGRAALEMIAREVEQADATGLSNSYNFLVQSPPGAPYLLLQQLPGTTEQRTNSLQNLVFTTRENQTWKAIAYAVSYSNWIGTLYRYETNCSALAPDQVSDLANQVFNARRSRVMDNILCFRMIVYDSLGLPLNPDWNIKVINPDQMDLQWGAVDGNVDAVFLTNAIPAYVDIELGVLEAKTADRARTIGEDSLNAQEAFLTRQAGRVQVFRQRIPIRTVDPSVFE